MPAHLSSGDRENQLTFFSHKQLASFNRFDILLDDLDTVPVSALQRTNPRKQLQFLPLDDLEGIFFLKKIISYGYSHSFCEFQVSFQGPKYFNILHLNNFCPRTSKISIRDAHIMCQCSHWQAMLMLLLTGAILFSFSLIFCNFCAT